MATVQGCTTYQKRWAEIYFPGDTVCCARCPLLETYARKQCRKTGEYIVDDRVPGIWCPLKEHPEDPVRLPEMFTQNEK